MEKQSHKLQESKKAVDEQRKNMWAKYPDGCPVKSDSDDAARPDEPPAHPEPPGLHKESTVPMEAEEADLENDPEVQADL